MSELTRDEMNARLEAPEARMDARLVSIEGKIDAMLGRMDSRDQVYQQRFSSLEQRFANMEDALRETRQAIYGLKSTTIVTAISAVLAIVLGVAAFNATVLSNMVAAFESGKTTASAQAELTEQLRGAVQTLKALTPAVEREMPQK